MQFYHGDEHYYLTQILKNDIFLKETIEKDEFLQGDYYLLAYKLADLYVDNNLNSKFEQGLTANEIYEQELENYTDANLHGSSYVSFLGYDVDYPKTLVEQKIKELYYRASDNTFWTDENYHTPYSLDNNKTYYAYDYKSLEDYVEHAVYKQGDIYYEDKNHTVQAVIYNYVIYHEIHEDRYFWVDEDNNYNDCVIVNGYAHNNAFFADEKREVLIPLDDDEFKIYYDIKENKRYVLNINKFFWTYKGEFEEIIRNTCDQVDGYYNNGYFYEDEEHTITIKINEDTHKIYYDLPNDTAYQMSFVRNMNVTSEQAATIQNQIYEVYEVDKRWFLEENRELYVTILKAFKYGAIRHFFYENRHKFLPQFDWYLIEEDNKRKAIVDTLFKEYDKFTNLVDSLENYSDPDTIPDKVLIYMMELVGLTVNDYNNVLNEEQVRSLIKNLVEVYRYKGSLYSFELFFGCMGIDCGIQELYFDRRMFYNSTGENPWTRVETPMEFAYYLTPNNPVTTSYSFYVGEGKKNARRKLDKNIAQVAIKDSVTWSDITYPISEHVWSNTARKLDSFEEKDRDNALKTMLGFLEKGDEGWYDFGNMNTEIFTYYKTNFVLFNFTNIGHFKDGAPVTQAEKNVYASLVDKILPVFIQKYYANVFIEINSEDDIIHYGIDEFGNTDGFNFRDTDTYDSYQYYLLDNPSGGGDLSPAEEQARVKFTSPWNWAAKGANHFGDITRGVAFFGDYRLSNYIHSAESYYGLGYAENDVYGYKVFIDKYNKPVVLIDNALYYVNNIVDGYYYDNKFYRDAEHTEEILGEENFYYVDLLTSITYIFREGSFIPSENGIEKLGPWYVYAPEKGFIPLSVQYRVRNRYYNKKEDKWFIFSNNEIVEYDNTRIEPYTEEDPEEGVVYRKADGTYVIYHNSGWVEYSPKWDKVQIAYYESQKYGTIPTPFSLEEDGIYHNILEDTYFVHKDSGDIPGNFGKDPERLADKGIYGYSFFHEATGETWHKFYIYTIADGIKPYPATDMPEGSYTKLVVDNPYYTRNGTVYNYFVYKPDTSFDGGVEAEFLAYNNNANRYDFANGTLEDEEYYAETKNDNSSTANLATDPFSYTEEDYAVKGGYGYENEPEELIYSAKVNFDYEGNPAHTSDISIADLVENGFYDIIGGRIIDEDVIYLINIDGVDTWVNIDNQHYYKFVPVVGGPDKILDIEKNVYYDVLDRKNDKSVYKVILNQLEYWQFYDGTGMPYLISCDDNKAYKPSSQKANNVGYYFEGQFYSDREHQHPLYTKGSITGNYKGEVEHFDDLFDHFSYEVEDNYGALFTIQEIEDEYEFIASKIGDIYQVNEPHEQKPAKTWWIWTGTKWDAMTPGLDSVCADITTDRIIYYVYNGSKYIEFGFPGWEKVGTMELRDGRYYLSNSVRVYPELLVDTGKENIVIRPSNVESENITVDLEREIKIDPEKSKFGTFSEEGEHLFEHITYSTRMSSKPALGGKPGFYIDNELKPKRGLGKFYEVERYFLTEDKEPDPTKTYFRYNALLEKYEVVKNAKKEEMNTYYEYESPGLEIIPEHGMTYVDVTDERKPKYYVWSETSAEWTYNHMLWYRDGVYYADENYVVELKTPEDGVVYRDGATGIYYIHTLDGWEVFKAGKYIRQIVPGTTYVTGDDFEACDDAGNPYYEINMDYYEYTNPIEYVSYDLKSDITIEIL